MLVKHPVYIKVNILVTIEIKDDRTFRIAIFIRKIFFNEFLFYSIEASSTRTTSTRLRFLHETNMQNVLNANVIYSNSSESLPFFKQASTFVIPKRETRRIEIRPPSEAKRKGRINFRLARREIDRA